MKPVEPLTQWWCDTCGEPMNIADGWLEWIDPNNVPQGFRIVHNRAKCFHYTNHPHRSDNHLEYFLGPEGLQKFLSKLDVGPILNPENKWPGKIGDMPNFVDTIRRLHIPFYEEARRYFAEAQGDGFFDGANEVYVHLPSTCEALIERYKK